LQEEGRRKKEEGRRKKEEGRRKREEGFSYLPYKPYFLGKPDTTKYYFNLSLIGC